MDLASEARQIPCGFIAGAGSGGSQSPRGYKISSRRGNPVRSDGRSRIRRGSVAILAVDGVSLMSYNHQWSDPSERERFATESESVASDGMTLQGLSWTLFPYLVQSEPLSSGIC